MPYLPESVISTFETEVYRVEIRSTETDIQTRIVEIQTGREFTADQVGMGLQLRLQDEKAKAGELIRRQVERDDARRARQHRNAWDAYRMRKAALVERSHQRIREHN